MPSYFAMFLILTTDIFGGGVIWGFALLFLNCDGFNYGL